MREPSFLIIIGGYDTFLSASLQTIDRFKFSPSASVAIIVICRTTSGSSQRTYLNDMELIQMLDARRFCNHIHVCLSPGSLPWTDIFMVNAWPRIARDAEAARSSASSPLYVISSCWIEGPISANVLTSGGRFFPSTDRLRILRGRSLPDKSASLTTMNHLLFRLHGRVQCR